MDTSLLLAVTFFCGLAASFIRLPPLVGFLAAGFILNAIGFEMNDTIAGLADLGVTLLLFTVGLKLDVRVLLRREVWGSAGLHMGLSVLVFSLVLVALKGWGFSTIDGLDTQAIWVLAFALSFSSTVFAIKLLEEKSELNALYGRIAVGILIMQDIFAVVFLAFSTGKVPSLWALSLLALIPLRPLLFHLLNRVGHGELQLLFGFFLTFVVGTSWFEAVGLKGDLGALCIGIMLAGHPAASGMAKSLFSFKELFLIAFFLSIGLSHLPDLEAIIVAAILLVILFIKALLFLAVLMRNRLRSRTALLGTISLSNYSEFGLIVVAVAATNQWIDGSWLATIAIALSFSFVFVAPLHANADRIYQSISPTLRRFQRSRLLSEDQAVDFGEHQVIVFGMGRIGSGAYNQLEQHYPGQVLGIDTDTDKVNAHRQAGRSVIVADATDSDFWAKLSPSSNIKLVLLAMPSHHGNEYALSQLRRNDLNTKIAAIAQYSDDADSLTRLGADAVFNLYNEAGSGFAQHVYQELVQEQATILQAHNNSSNDV
ncbi:potassium transporter Kef [Alginatibacterium sediminis]|uniref:Potassium transporter Kef n=1 Tax=Alginatibacterium sediminis TaxID=2164068 RepID=A0A420EIE6_9ALTE|nr:cation:proton antiporter family protein [Alginatibacterium sediminis]RKF20414.1 potassium transporter Kef [Alginatibacterium sediminis]